MVISGILVKWREVVNMGILKRATLCPPPAWGAGLRATHTQQNSFAVAKMNNDLVFAQRAIATIALFDGHVPPVRASAVVDDFTLLGTENILFPMKGIEN
jgi:hypothetical protein